MSKVEVEKKEEENDKKEEEVKKDEENDIVIVKEEKKEENIILKKEGDENENNIGVKKDEDNKNEEEVNNNTIVLKVDKIEIEENMEQIPNDQENNVNKNGEVSSSIINSLFNNYYIGQSSNHSRYNDQQPALQLRYSQSI